MPCIVDISPNEEINHWQVLLCQACKYLTLMQIASLRNPSGIVDGLDWYSQHLMNDYSHRCFNRDVLDSDYETNEWEKHFILEELNRIGYDLIVKTTSIELIRLNDERLHQRRTK